MRIAEHTIHISRTPDDVFDFFIDFSKSATWRQYVRTITRVDHGPVTAGSRLHVTMDISGESREFDLDVLVCDRPSLWRHRSNDGDFNGFVEYRFAPENGGTRVTMSIEARPAGLYGWLAVPLLWLRRDKPYKEQLPQLKHAIEAA